MNKHPMSRTESHAYWIKRHEEYEGNWRATGFLGGDDAINQAIYSCRFRALNQVLASHRITLSGKRVLDVGCGLGDFARFYAARGAYVSGIDISSTAVAYCNAYCIGEFVQGGASEVAAKFKQPFDLIHCFDVLYHLTDDAEWQSALASFEERSRPETVWLFTEFRICTSVSGAEHIVKRPISYYQNELARHGRHIVEEIPIYWLFTLSPWLGRRLPWLLSRVDGLGRFFVPHLHLRQWVALWVILGTGLGLS